MEDHLINAAGNDVTPAFYDYLRPLLGADMIEVARLRGAKVEKAGEVAAAAPAPKPHLTGTTRKVAF